MHYFEPFTKNLYLYDLNILRFGLNKDETSKRIIENCVRKLTLDINFLFGYDNRSVITPSGYKIKFKLHD